MVGFLTGSTKGILLKMLAEKPIVFMDMTKTLRLGYKKEWLFSKKRSDYIGI